MAGEAIASGASTATPAITSLADTGKTPNLVLSNSCDLPFSSKGNCLLEPTRLVTVRDECFPHYGAFDFR